jgi:hypothetical protein
MLLACVALSVGTADAARKPKDEPEVQIAKLLEGRTAGEPVNCISMQSIRSSRIIDKTAILYTMNNGTIYLNRPTAGATSLRNDMALFTKTPSSQLCSVETVTLFDSVSHMYYGWVGLGQFVPYPKPAKAE